MFTPLGLDHVVFRVKDQTASQRFYVDVLGCTVDHVNERISLVHLRFGEHYIDLLPATATEPATVADELRRRGVAIEGEIAQRRGAYGTGPSIYIRDPDGHIVELKPRPT